MTIVAGDRLPAATLKVVTPDGAVDQTTEEIFGGKRIVLFGVPGAFTPTCSNNHLPGFLENHDAILARGVDAIAVVANNDHHVMAAWARFSGGEGKLVFLADGNSAFIRALGMEVDMSKGGLGLRTRRFSMIVEDGVVTTVNTGDMPGQAIEAGASRILEQLDGQTAAA
jgi:peroxiredoxin